MCRDCAPAQPVHAGIVGDMGDSFEVVVDVEATLDQAPRLGGPMISWLTVEGVIDASPTGDRDGWGAGYYLPGPKQQGTAASLDGPYAPAFTQLTLGPLEFHHGR